MLLFQCLDIRRVVLAPDDPDLGTSLNGLANVLEEAGQFDEAEDMYKQVCVWGCACVLQCDYIWFVQALTFFRRTLPPYHPWLGMTLWNLGLLYCNHMDRFGEAAELFDEAAGVYSVAHGPDHAETQDARQWAAKASALQ